MSDLSRALRKAEDGLTYALVEEQVNPAFAGSRRLMQELIVKLRAMAGILEHYEDAETIGGNVGQYLPSTYPRAMHNSADSAQRDPSCQGVAWMRVPRRCSLSTRVPL
jgi:hypothetical protein